MEDTSSMWNTWGLWCHSHGWDGSGTITLCSSNLLEICSYSWRVFTNDSMDLRFFDQSFVCCVSKINITVKKTFRDLWISVSPVRRSPTLCGSTRVAPWPSPLPLWPLTSHSASLNSQSSARVQFLSQGTVSICHHDRTSHFHDTFKIKLDSKNSFNVGVRVQKHLMIQLIIIRPSSFFTNVAHCVFKDVVNTAA